jgi:hypothetical protein
MKGNGQTEEAYAPLKPACRPCWPKAPVQSPNPMHEWEKRRRLHKGERGAPGGGPGSDADVSILRPRLTPRSRWTGRVDATQAMCDIISFKPAPCIDKAGSRSHRLDRANLPGTIDGNRSLAAARWRDRGCRISESATSCTRGRRAVAAYIKSSSQQPSVSRSRATLCHLPHA